MSVLLSFVKDASNVIPKYLCSLVLAVRVNLSLKLYMQLCDF